MLNLDRDALICDLAETYHIYDMRELPVLTLAALSVGLRDDSRIKMRLLGRKYMSPIMLMSLLVDDLQVLRAALTSMKEATIPGGYVEAFTRKAEMAREEKEQDVKYVSVRNSIVEDARHRAQEVKDG